MQALKLNWEEIFHLHTPGTADEEGRIQQKELISKYQKVFKEEMGLLEGATVSISVRSGTTPLFFKPRFVPYVCVQRATRTGVEMVGMRQNYRGRSII